MQKNFQNNNNKRTPRLTARSRKLSVTGKNSNSNSPAGSNPQLNTSGSSKLGDVPENGVLNKTEHGKLLTSFAEQEEDENGTK